MFSIIFLVAILIIMIVGMILARHWEKKDYNNGICTQCGGHLEHFDDDSQGGRGYRCDKCGRYVWVTYNVDKEKR